MSPEQKEVLVAMVKEWEKKMDDVIQAGIGIRRLTEEVEAIRAKVQHWLEANS
jgi:hypothetical protein